MELGFYIIVSLDYCQLRSLLIRKTSQLAFFKPDIDICHKLTIIININDICHLYFHEVSLLIVVIAAIGVFS